MYKNLGDLKHYLERTGSHSTKEHRTGRIDAIPEWAKEPEEYYNSVRDRWRNIIEQLISTQGKLAEINKQLRVTLPHKEFEHLKQHKDALSNRIQILEREQIEYRPLARAAGERSWATIFYHLAEKLLIPEDFVKIQKQTEEILNRPQVEIHKGRTEFSDEKRLAVNLAEKRRLRRVKYKRTKTGAAVVWSDEQPIEKQYEIRNEQKPRILTKDKI